jgi:GTP-binding protein
MDLPGYGFAKVSNAEKERWSNLIESYLHKSQNLAHVFLLLDIRHKPTSDDLTMIKWLNYYQKPFSIIATKADKLSKSQLSKQLLELSRETGMIVNDIYPVSSISGQGKDKILLKIGEILQNYSLKQQD